MNTVAAFSPDYATARRRFRAAASLLGWELEAHPLGGEGPDGEPLAVDVALSPGGGSQRALVVSGGLHGVEGFVGSAVQLGLLERWTALPAPGVRCLFLHGLNPFGFAWLRRFDENNVDPNRNFLLAGERYAGSPAGYAALDGLLNPRRPPSWWDPFRLEALLAVTRHGLPALKQAVATGQYDFPRGLFYGGAGPSRTNRLLAENLPRWLGGAREVVHLDFHTGLGAWAGFKLLIEPPLLSSQRARLAGWFGADSFEVSDPRGVAYVARGDFGRWCVASNPGRDYLFACAEFGTHGPIQMLAGLRAENQAHHWGRPAGRAARRAKQHLVELFCPSSPAWRRRVLEQSFRLVEQALRGLAAERKVAIQPAAVPAGSHPGP